MPSSWKGRVKEFLTPDKELLPLKCTIFFYTCSAIALMPDLGISMEHITVMYTILPFLTILVQPTVGFMADMLGSYTRVLILTLIGDCIFYSLVFTVPEIPTLPAEVGLSFSNGASVTLMPNCPKLRQSEECHFSLENVTNIDVILTSCSSRCASEHDQSEDICNYFQGSHLACHSNVSEAESSFTLHDLTFSPGKENCSEMQQGTFHANNTPIEMRSECELSCKTTSLSSFSNCEPQRDHGYQIKYSVMYFMFFALGAMCMGCNFLMIDTQALQMCNGDSAEEEQQAEENSCEKSEQREEKEKKRNSMSRQFVVAGVAQITVSPLVGKLMDVVSKGTGKVNYLVPFLCKGCFLIVTAIMVTLLKLNMELPKPKGLHTLKVVFKNPEVVAFIFINFFMGNMWGFVETFLFVYLKDEMNAPMFLLGMTITVGALTTIPVLMVADWIKAKIGRMNVFILALVVYAVRFIGYSYITNPWLAFPFEALEVFNNIFMRVTAIEYTGSVAPKGLLATLNGFIGGLHYGMGKATGCLIGGALITTTDSIALTFRIFGFAALFMAVAYSSFQYLVVPKLNEKLALESSSEEAAAGDKKEVEKEKKEMNNNSSQADAKQAT